MAQLFPVTSAAFKSLESTTETLHWVQGGTNNAFTHYPKLQLTLKQFRNWHTTSEIRKARATTTITKRVQPNPKEYEENKMLDRYVWSKPQLRRQPLMEVLPALEMCHTSYNNIRKVKQMFLKISLLNTSANTSILLLLQSDIKFINLVSQYRFAGYCQVAETKGIEKENSTKLSENKMWWEKFFI